MINKNTDDINAICPSCKKQLYVDPSEEVIICEFCGKAFSVKGAINSYEAEKIRAEKCVQAAKKPLDEVTEKFYKILEQNYILAQRFLDDYIAKEYSSCKELLKLTIDDIRYYRSWGGDDLTPVAEELFSINPTIRKMQYKVICKMINSEYRDKRNLTFTGNVGLLKECWLDDKVQAMEATMNLIHLDINYYGREKKDGESTWGRIERSIKRCYSFEQKINDNLTDNYDDDFIDFVIAGLQSISDIKFQKLGDDGWHWYYVRDFVDKYSERVDKLIVLLQDLYSPTKKKEIHLKKERAYKEKFEWQIGIWQRYIDLLKSGKTKMAYNLLRYENNPAKKQEIAKFKRVFFGVKYFGDISALSAKELAELALSKNK